jgi:hypothetical protein
LHGIARFTLLIASLLVVFPAFIGTIRAQPTSQYWVTVMPTAPGLAVHSPLGHNWTVSFRVTWTYGSNIGQVIGNATMPINVTTHEVVLETLLLKTNDTGYVSFNYASSSPSSLTFVPTKLVTEDGVEWNSSLLEGAYGFQSSPIAIYWDSFGASLVKVDTSAMGVARLTINVTYLLIPQEGITALQPSNYSHYDYVPIYVHGADVRVDGVEAEESSVLGVYTAQISTGLPEEYVLVQISQQGCARFEKRIIYRRCHSAGSGFFCKHLLGDSRSGKYFARIRLALAYPLWCHRLYGRTRWNSNVENEEALCINHDCGVSPPARKCCCRQILIRQLPVSDSLGSHSNINHHFSIERNLHWHIRGSVLPVAEKRVLLMRPTPFSCNTKQRPRC